MVELQTPLSQFPTVKKAILKKLHSLGLRRAADLLYYFPFRYDDFSKIVSIKDIRPDVPVTISGKIQLLGAKRSFVQRKMLTEGIVSDATGQLRVVWFNQPYIIKNLKIGDQIFLAGRAELNKYGLQLVNPVYEKERRDGSTLNTGRLVPVYPTTYGLSQKQIRFLIKTALEAAGQLSEWLPEKIIKQNNFLPLRESLREVHFPTAEKKFDQAKNRFQFEELFLIQLRNELWRRNLLRDGAAPVIKFQEDATRAFVEHLPFKLTADQRSAAWEILQDLEKRQPMNRLLDGDVGSGKTVVAAVAVLNAVINGYQAAIMAPTEILAGQHYETFKKLFDGFEVKTGLITRGARKMNYESKSINQKTNNSLFIIHNSDLIIGTHALVEEKLKFKKLGLAIVDEQHRFGVAQRHKLQKKGKGSKLPHFLSMTATPIPRSYALSLYGDLDLSLIKQKPVGRKPIITKLVEEINRSKAYDFVRNQIKLGRQAFVICPLIESESRIMNNELRGEKKSVLREYQKLSEEIFPDLRIVFLHGRMKAGEKEEVMRKFLAREFDILVSTSVVEVGVDVPNSSLMIIEGADRFGLAQLHQFRGRVGRSDHQSYCLLFSDAVNKKTKERLEYFAANGDGFALAEKDLETRGPGEVFGTTQHGFPELKMADLSDLELVKKSRAAAKEILDEDIDLANYPSLKEKIKDWEKDVHLE